VYLCDKREREREREGGETEGNNLERHIRERNDRLEDTRQGQDCYQSRDIYGIALLRKYRRDCSFAEIQSAREIRYTFTCETWDSWRFNVESIAP
jgi:hypothetical protein